MAERSDHWDTAPLALRIPEVIVGARAGIGIDYCSGIDPHAARLEA